jgi:hypothetical protein
MTVSLRPKSLNVLERVRCWFRACAQVRRRGRRYTAAPCVKSLETRVQPAVHTWTGASSAVWSNAGNWLGGSPAGDAQAQLIFPATAAHLTNTNDLTGLSIASLSIAGSNYQITGKGVQLGAGGIATTNATGTDEIDLAFQLLANSSVGATDGGTTLTMGGPISGTYPVTVSGGGTVVFAGNQANSYGATDVTAGTLVLGKTGAVAVPGALTVGGGPTAATVLYLADNQVADTAAVTVGANGVLQLNNASDVIGPLTLVGGTVGTGLGTLTLTGDVTVAASATTASMSGNLDLGGTQRNFNIAAGAASPSLSIAATISDGEIIKQGPGSLYLSAATTVLPYQITNGPANWGQTGAPLNNFYTFAVDNGVLFAGGRAQQGSGGPTARILYSTDGQTWNQVSMPFTTGDQEVRRLFVGADGALYAVTQGEAHIYRSPNGLSGWQLVATLDPTVDYGRWFTEFNGYIYLGTVNHEGSGAFIYRSNDGVHWSVAYQFASAINRVQSLLAIGSELFASTGDAGSGQAGGVFATTDGLTWTKVNTTQWQGRASLLVHSLTSWDGELWAGTLNNTAGAAVFASSDGGATWQQMTPNGFGFGQSEHEAYRLFVWQGNLVVGTYDPTSGGRLWITPDGSHWYELGAPGDGFGNLYQGVFDFTVFNGQLYSAERAPSVKSSVATRPFSISLLPTTIEIDAGSVTAAGSIGGSVHLNGGTFNGHGLAAAPTVTGQDSAVVAGKAVTDVLVATFTNPAAAGTPGRFSANVAWGDGQTSNTAAGTVTVLADPARPGIYDVLATKPNAYTLATTFALQVTVADALGQAGGTFATVTVNPGAAARLVLSTPPTATAGAAFGMTLTVLDDYGNVATGYLGTVNFTSSDAHAVLPADYTFTPADSGSHTFPAVLDTAGVQTITARDTAAAAVLGGSSVAVGTAAAKLTLSAPRTVTAGVPFAVTLTVTDAFGNVLTEYTGTVQFTSTDPQAVLPAVYTFTAADAGRHTFVVELETAGAQTVTARDTAAAALETSGGLDVSAAAGAALDLPLAALDPPEVGGAS